MKKSIKSISAILLIIALCLTALCACGSPQKALSGRWESTNGSIGFNTLEFFEDGTYTSSHANYNGSYSVDGDRIKLNGVLASPMTFTYKLDGDTLTLYYVGGSKDQAGVYERVK